jgi:hypothetical protein
MNAMPARTPSPRRHEGDAINQFAAIVWKGGHAENIAKYWFDSPVDALATAVSYLKAGYQARLSDGAVRYFAELPDREQVIPLPDHDQPPVPRFSSGGS